MKLRRTHGQGFSLQAVRGAQDAVAAACSTYVSESANACSTTAPVQALDSSSAPSQNSTVYYSRTLQSRSTRSAHRKPNSSKSRDGDEPTFHHVNTFSPTPNLVQPLVEADKVGVQNEQTVRKTHDRQIVHLWALETREISGNCEQVHVKHIVRQ